MKNYKTTLVGIFFAVANVVLPLLQGNNISTKDILISAFGAAIGFLAKDFNVTGGTVGQPTITNIPTIPSPLPADTATSVPPKK